MLSKTNTQKIGELLQLLVMLGILAMLITLGACNDPYDQEINDKRWAKVQTFSGDQSIRLYWSVNSKPWNDREFNNLSTLWIDELVKGDVLNIKTEVKESAYHKVTIDRISDYKIAKFCECKGVAFKAIVL